MLFAWQAGQNGCNAARPDVAWDNSTSHAHLIQPLQAPRRRSRLRTSSPHWMCALVSWTVSFRFTCALVNVDGAHFCLLDSVIIAAD